MFPTVGHFKWRWPVKSLMRRKPFSPLISTAFVSKTQMWLLQQTLHQLHVPSQPHANPWSKTLYVRPVWEGLPIGPVPPQPPEDSRRWAQPLWLSLLLQELPDHAWTGPAPVHCCCIQPGGSVVFLYHVGSTVYLWFRSQKPWVCLTWSFIYSIYCTYI